MSGTTSVSGQPTIDTTKYGKHLVTVKHNGNDITVSLEQALKGFMLQSDYSVKTEALAKARAEIQGKQARYDKMDAFFSDMERDPAGSIAQLQRHYNVQPDPGSVSGDIDPDDEVAVMQAEMARLKSQIEQTTAQSQVQEAERQFVEQFPDMDIDDVRAYLTANSMPQDALIQGAKLLSYDQLAEASRLQEESKQQSQAALDAITADKMGLPPVNPGAAPLPGPDIVSQTDPPLLTWEEAAVSAKAELGAGSTIDP